MTNESSSAGRPPAKLGDSGENDWVRGLPGEKPGKASSRAPDCHDDPSGRAVIEQIFEELRAAQLRAVPPEPVAQDTPQGRASDLQFFQASHAAEGISGAGSFSGQSVSSATKVKRRNGERLRGICGRSAAAFATEAATSKYQCTWVHIPASKSHIQLAFRRISYIMVAHESTLAFTQIRCHACCHRRP